MYWFLILGLGFTLGIGATLTVGLIIHYIVKSIKDYIDERFGK